MRLQDYLYVSTQRTQHHGMLILPFLNLSPSRRISWLTTQKRQHQNIVIVPLLNLSRRTLFWKTPILMPPEETTFTVYQNWLWFWVLWFSKCEQDVCVVYINLQMLVQILNVNYKTMSLSFKKEYLGWRRVVSWLLLSNGVEVTLVVRGKQHRQCAIAEKRETMVKGIC